jgi:anti-sigma-K factor RskA
VNTPAEQNLKELAAAYALGALDPAEAQAFERVMAGSPEVAREVAEYREVGALLALGPGTSAAPSADLRARVLARAAQSKVVPLAPRPRAGAWLAWAAVAASLVAAAGLAFQRQSLRQDLAARDSTIAALQSTLAVREAKLASREATLNAILEPGVSLTRLNSTGAPEPGLQLFWNRSTNVAIAHAFRLTPASARRVYQLWFIPKSGKPIPSVTFNSEPSGHALVEQIPVPAGVELVAAAITDEPEGGSEQPTTPIVLVGSFVPAKS